MVTTHQRRIEEIQETQEELRKEIDRMAPGADRERRIDFLMDLHDEIRHLHDEERAAS